MNTINLVGALSKRTTEVSTGNENDSTVKELLEVITMKKEVDPTIFA